MCFVSVSTVYLDGAFSGGSVEKTSAPSTFPASSAAYDEIPASGTNVAFVSPYCFCRPTKQVFRVLHSGRPPNLNAPTFFMSEIVFRPYFFAVAFVTANASVSKNGVGFRTV